MDPHIFEEYQHCSYNKQTQRRMSKFIRLTALEFEIMQVLVAHKRLYGLKVMKLLNEGRKEYGLPEISYGSFYPALKKLETSKLLSSDWGSDNDKSKRGSRRRYYEINPKGKKTYEANQEYGAWVEEKLQMQTV